MDFFQPSQQPVPIIPSDQQSDVMPGINAPGTGNDTQGDSHPLRPLVKAWLQKITDALAYKRKNFSDAADEILYFLHGGSELNKFLWENQGRGRGGYLQNGGDSEVDDLAPPGFRFTMNKVAEVLQLFAPTLYYQNPVRTVTPRRLEPIAPEVFQVLAGPPPQPPPQLAQAAQSNPQVAQQIQVAQQQYLEGIIGQVQQQQQNDATMRTIETVRAELMSDLLNYTPNELDLKTNSRRVIDECLLKGMGVWWTELYEPRGMQTRLAGSFFDTVDNLILDCDVQLIEDCTWTARRRVSPQWELERTYSLPHGALDHAMGSAENTTIASEASTDPDRLDKRRRAVTNKIITYYEVFSKMGLGGRMTGIPKELKETFDGFGDFCRLVLVPGIPYPLNLPSQIVNSVPKVLDPQAAAEWSQRMQEAVEWPIPFWAFDNGWPFTTLVFHEVPNRIWPMSHIAPGLGELKWINWAMSWLASKVKNSCGTLIAVAKSMDPAEKAKVTSVGDQRIIEVEVETGGANDVGKLVAYVQQPPFHAAIAEMVDRVSEIFDKRIGLSEILYGMSGSQSRSATDSSIKQQNASIRLKDMADRVKDSQAILGRKEAFVSRWFLTGQDVAPALGQDRAALWEKLVQSADIETVVRELDYRIEAGTMQIIDRQAQIENLQGFMQATMPFLQQIAMAWGEVGPWNAVMEDYGKLNNLDVSRYMIKNPQQMQPQAQPGAPAPPGAQGQPGNPQQQGPPPVQPRPGQHGTGEPPRQAA